ncbi:UDP-N-acetylmuramoyl-tripeptide--D-alanyl-D-alanine ligase [Pradoshia sp.]|uniref:UDP-N-acetylmuramoyl-tripeptide--D-alanyl-D- alanine ligase n=1 Tax=Pradoshia sp. TaxID=2651281 RepID=UPI003EFF408B
MIKRTLAEIAAMVDGQIHDSMKEVVVAGVTTDTRKITNANLFVPLQGEKSNGHDHVQQAFEQGASASFWEHNQPNPPEGAALVFVDDSLKALQQLAKAYLNELDTKVIGITGSNGKTTTKDMTASILGTKYRVHKTSGNFNNHIGLPLTVLSAPEDTEMLILEMGMSSRGEISLLSKIGQPDAAIITNIGESHLLDLGSREGIADAKMEIVEGLKPDGVLIYNGDEPLLINRVTDLEIRKISFGRSLTNDYYPLKIESGQDDMKFTIEKEGQHEFLLPVLGTHNVLNSMAAIAVGREMGVSFDEIAKGLSELKLTNMRMEVTFGAKGEKIINDAYNASPTSMKAAIELVKAMTDATKKILVLGDMLELGPEEAAYHYKMGELITEEIDYVLAYGELSANLAEGAKGNLGAERVFHFDDKQALVQKLKELTEPHALVLVKASRGMRLEEVVGAL